MTSEREDRIKQISAILNAVSFATEQKRQKQIQDLVNKNWPVEQIYRDYEFIIQPQKLEQVKEELKRKK